jgi:hypothetical protein
MSKEESLGRANFKTVHDAPFCQEAREMNVAVFVNAHLSKHAVPNVLLVNVL